MESRDSQELPDLVRDTKLEAEIRGSFTVHTWPWKRQKREIWKRDPEPIGSGGYGLVWLERQVDHRLQPLGTRVRAVKQIRATRPENMVRECFRELEAVAKFSQDKYADHFVKSSGWFEGPGSLYLAMEFCARGDLKAYVVSKGALPEAEAKIVTRQILIALAHMHGEKFAHRDLKPANILIVSHPPDSWIVKLSDFGVTKRSIAEDSTTAKGTFAFLPPELLGKNNRRCDPIAADIWSAGESSYYLLTSKSAFDDFTTRIRHASDNEAFPYNTLIETGASVDAQQLIQSLMQGNPGDRPSAEYALGMPWVSVEEDDPFALPLADDDWEDLRHLSDAPEASARWSTGFATEGIHDGGESASHDSAVNHVANLAIAKANEGAHISPQTQIVSATSDTFTPATLRLNPSNQDNDQPTSSQSTRVTPGLDESHSHQAEKSHADLPVDYFEGTGAKVQRMPGVNVRAMYSRRGKDDHTQTLANGVEETRQRGLGCPSPLDDTVSSRERERWTRGEKSDHTGSARTPSAKRGVAPRKLLPGSSPDGTPVATASGGLATDASTVTHQTRSVADVNWPLPMVTLTGAEAGLRPNHLTKSEWSNIISGVAEDGGSYANANLPHFGALAILFHIQTKKDAGAQAYYVSFTKSYRRFRQKRDNFEPFSARYTCMLTLLILLNRQHRTTLPEIRNYIWGRQGPREISTWQLATTLSSAECQMPRCLRRFGHGSHFQPYAQQCLSCWGLYCKSHREEDTHRCPLAGVWQTKVHYYQLVRSAFLAFDGMEAFHTACNLTLKVMQNWVPDVLDGMDTDSVRIVAETGKNHHGFPPYTYSMIMAESIIIGRKPPIYTTTSFGLVLDSESVDDQHVLLLKHEGKWMIQKFWADGFWATVNGSFLRTSSRRLSFSHPEVLKSGDVIQLGREKGFPAARGTAPIVAMRVYFFDDNSLLTKTRNGHLPGAAQTGCPTDVTPDLDSDEAKLAAKEGVTWVRSPLHTEEGSGFPRAHQAPAFFEESQQSPQANLVAGNQGGLPATAGEFEALDLSQQVDILRQVQEEQDLNSDPFDPEKQMKIYNSIQEQRRREVEVEEEEARSR